MNTSRRMKQVWTISRLQLRYVFFSRRSLWVYLLAIFPAVLFFGHGIVTKIQRDRLMSGAVPAAILESLAEGDTEEQVLARAGHPIEDQTFNAPPRRAKGKDRPPVRRIATYFDGRRRWFLSFEAGILQHKRSALLVNLEEDRQVFAAIFQNFYLRLAVFFGCLGIFMNLFRGEMLDKTLHFGFLTAARREVLLGGKYLAGLLAAVSIFTAGAALAFAAMLSAQDPAEAAAFWHAQGMGDLFWYVASAALGCFGYGAVFLAAGLLVRNPIVPAVILLLWEGINGVLPPALQRISVLFYVQSLAPVPVPAPSDAPLLIRLLIAPAEPPSALVAVLGLFALTALVLWSASRAVRRLEVNYGAE